MAYQTIPFKNFNGLNNSATPDSLLPSELSIAENVLFGTRGGYTKAWGRVRHNPTEFNTEPIKRLMPHYRKDGTVTMFIASGTSVRVDDGTGTFPTVKNADGTVHVFSSVNFDFYSWSDDKLYLVNGTLYKRIYYSTANTRWQVEAVPPKSGADLTGVNKCNIHEYYEGWARHYFAGDPTDRGALYFSEDSDPTNILNSTNKVYPTSNLGPVITVKAWNQNILVGYKRGWMRWLGGGTTSTLAITADWHRVKASSGPVSNRATERVRNLFVYAAEDGVYVFDSVNVANEDNARKISQDIDEFYKSLVNKENMAAVFDGRYLLIAACNGAMAENNIVLVADFDVVDEEGNPAWSVLTECYANDFLLNDGVIFYAHSKTGLVMKFSKNNFNNDGQVLPVTTEHYLNLYDRYRNLNPFALHTIKNFIIKVSTPCTVTVTCGYKEIPFDVILGDSFAWGDEWGKPWGYSDPLGKSKPINKQTQQLKVKLKHSTLDENFTLLAFGVEYRPGKTKGSPIKAVKREVKTELENLPLDQIENLTFDAIENTKF